MREDDKREAPLGGGRPGSGDAGHFERNIDPRFTRQRGTVGDAVPGGCGGIPDLERHAPIDPAGVGGIDPQVRLTGLHEFDVGDTNRIGSEF